MQYFCLHAILANPTLKQKAPDQPQSAGEESILPLCVSFVSTSKAINVFPKDILNSKTRDQSIQASKKLFCHVMVKNYLCNVSQKFLIKIKSTWTRKIPDNPADFTVPWKDCQKHPPEVLHKKQLFLKILQYPQETSVSVQQKCCRNVADLQTCNFIKKRPQHRCFPVNIAKFLILPILKNICKRLFCNFFNG